MSIFEQPKETNSTELKLEIETDKTLEALLDKGNKFKQLDEIFEEARARVKSGFIDIEELYRSKKRELTIGLEPEEVQEARRLADLNEQIKVKNKLIDKINSL